MPYGGHPLLCVFPMSVIVSGARTSKVAASMPVIRFCQINCWLNSLDASFTAVYICHMNLLTIRGRLLRILQPARQVARAVLVVLAGATLLAGPAILNQAQSASLLVFAAASLQGPLDKSAQSFGRANKVSIRIAYGSSGILARQIAQRAPADLFISASTQWMDYLEKQKTLISGSRRNLLSNTLVLISRKDDQTSGSFPGLPLLKLVGRGRLATGDPDHVPAGIYAKVALTRLGLWKAMKDRLARGNNVRAALALVARGEARFGIVYRSDALAERRVRIVASFPGDSPSAIVYPAAMIKGAKRKMAAALLAYLVSAKGRAPFLAAGFGNPEGP